MGEALCARNSSSTQWTRCLMVKQPEDWSIYFLCKYDIEGLLSFVENGRTLQCERPPMERIPQIKPNGARLATLLRYQIDSIFNWMQCSLRSYTSKDNPKFLPCHCHLSLSGLRSAEPLPISMSNNFVSTTIVVDLEGALHRMGSMHIYRFPSI